MRSVTSLLRGQEAIHPEWTENLLNAGKDGCARKKSYLIIRCATDPYGEGKGMYVFERRDQDGRALNDGSYIIYVNGEYDDLNTPLGKLIHDLKCNDVNKMMYNVIRKSVGKFKKNTEEQGENSMLGRVIEEYGEECRDEGRNEGRQEGKIDGAISAAKSLGATGDQLINTVAKSCNTTKAAVKEYLSKMNMK